MLSLTVYDAHAVWQHGHAPAIGAHVSPTRHHTPCVALIPSSCFRTLGSSRSGARCWGRGRAPSEHVDGWDAALLLGLIVYSQVLIVRSVRHAFCLPPLVKMARLGAMRLTHFTTHACISGRCRLHSVIFLSPSSMHQYHSVSKTSCRFPCLIACGYMLMPCM